MSNEDVQCQVCKRVGQNNIYIDYEETPEQKALKVVIAWHTRGDSGIDPFTNCERCKVLNEFNKRMIEESIKYKWIVCRCGHNIKEL